MDQKKLIRYLSGTSSDQEKREITNWLNSDPLNKREFDELKQLWEVSGKSHSVDLKLFDVQEDWDRLEKQMDLHDVPTPVSVSRPSLIAPERIGRNRFAPLLRVAAIVLVLLFTGVFYATNMMSSDSAETDQDLFREISTELGQRSNIVLSDGTQLTINADSKLNLPRVFRNDRREIHLLQGEIYIEVARDEERPFYIHSGEVTVEVLGTSFSVRSYPEDEQVRVVVDSGLVSFERTDGDEGLKLEPMQSGTYSYTSGHFIRSQIDDPELFLGWTKGFLKFQDTPLNQVIRELERRYNVNLELASPSIGEKLLTATLKGREIQNVLDVIATALSLDYFSNEDGSITFSVS